MTSLFLILGVLCGLTASQEMPGLPCHGISIEEKCKHTLAADFCGVTEECETKFWNARPENSGNYGAVYKFSSRDKPTKEHTYGASNNMSPGGKRAREPIFGTPILHTPSNTGETKIIK